MMTSGRIAAIAVLSICLGFVGGAWFIGSGYGLDLFPPPKVLPAGLWNPPRVSKQALASSTDAVGVPPSKSISMNSGGLPPPVGRTDLIPSPGCLWAIEPRTFEPGRIWHWVDQQGSIAGDGSIDLTTGGVRYLLVQWRPKLRGVNDLRPVFFDVNGQRMLTRDGSASSSISANGSFLMNEFFLDPVQYLALAQVAYFGIERVPADAARQLVRETQREARVKDLAILPPPRIGQPYPFDLATTDGQPIRAGDFKGKVVLFVLWGPDLNSLTGLMMAQRLRSTYPTGDLAIISVSFSESVEKAIEVAQKHAADGYLVVIPNEPETRRIWTNGGEIHSLPMLLLVDREGVLPVPFDPLRTKKSCRYPLRASGETVLTGDPPASAFQQAHHREETRCAMTDSDGPSASPSAPPGSRLARPRPMTRSES